MIYKTIHTKYALNKIVSAEASGVSINLTEMAVGDGNGNPVDPIDSQTMLVRERFRATINRVYSDPEDFTHFTAEMVIPASEGGFTLREVGVFDADGGLFVIGNLPETYKPTTSDGAYSDTVIRVEFVVSNTSVITMHLDPNIALATQTWISNNVTAAFLLPGGTTNQVLRKKSNIDGDTEWANQTDINVYVDMVEENQTLAENQTIVDWVTVINTGLAIYINGNRLRKEQWEPDDSINTRVILAMSYPDGTKITGVQNEPANSLPDPLEKYKNLADVPDKFIARANLAIYSKEETDQKAPAGAVVYFARNTAPTGWLKANGATISRIAYANLFAAIGTTYGAGDGFNTFSLPDLRGEFIRGWDDGRGADNGRIFGSWQSDQIKAHSHGVPNNGTTGSNYNTTARGDNSTADQYPQTTETGGTETRPRNRALLACIKY